MLIPKPGCPERHLLEAIAKAITDGKPIVEDDLLAYGITSDNIDEIFSNLKYGMFEAVVEARFDD